MNATQIALLALPPMFIAGFLLGYVFGRVAWLFRDKD